MMNSEHSSFHWLMMHILKCLLASCFSQLCYSVNCYTYFINTIILDNTALGFDITLYYLKHYFITSGELIMFVIVHFSELN